VVLSALAVPSAAMSLIGGTLTGSTQFGNVGAIGVVDDGTFYELCTGTLVAANKMLTAGHCTFDFAALEDDGDDVVATFDPVPTASSTFIDAVAFHTHPDYVNTLRGNSKCGLYGQCTTDVGVVQLASSPAGVTPATRASAGYLDTLNLKTQQFTVVGYGVSGFENANTPTGPPGGERRSGTLEAVPGQDVTRDLFVKLSGRHSGVETCYGDSGAPVFANGVVVAIDVFGQSLTCSSVGYYARLDSTSVSTWLTNVLA
jgi:hypothetical protein